MVASARVAWSSAPASSSALRCVSFASLARARARAYATQKFPSHAVVPMPALSPTMTRGGIVKWHAAVGAKIASGDALADVETDKATMVMEATEDGYLAAILVKEGSVDVEVGRAVCVIAEEERDVGAFSSYSVEANATTNAAPTNDAEKGRENAPTPTTKAPTAGRTDDGAGSGRSKSARVEGERVFASPLARRLAADRGARLENIRGSGPNGRIIADDVRSAREDAPAVAAAVHTIIAEHPLSKFFPEFEDASVNAIKRITAQRLTESKQQVPHFYLTVDIRMDKCMDIRKTLNQQLADDKTAAGAKISVNDFIIKASARSLLAVPDVNASWLGDKIRKYKKADISVAVQTERGLMVPIVRSACCLGLKSISSEVKALAGRARDGALTPQDMTGGTFTISNLGMFGVKSFAAIVNPPQAAILAVGGTRKEVVKTDAGYEEVLVMSATLSCDHRVVDGAVGAQWLSAFKGYLEDPMTMLL